MLAKPTPILLAIGRLFFLLGTILLLFLVAYVGAAAYYATRLTSSGGTHTTLSVASGDLLVLTSSLNLSNPGPFPINGLTVVAHLDRANGTPWLSAQTPPLDLAGGGRGAVQLRLLLPVQTLLGEGQLLVNDTFLPYLLWVNATYASLVVVNLHSIGSYHWGAPFYHLNASFGTASRASNGSVVVPMTIAFSNHAPFELDGALTVSFRSASGGFCGVVGIPVQAAAGANVQQSTTAYLPAGCPGLGGSYSAGWSGSGLAFALPGGSYP